MRDYWMNASEVGARNGLVKRFLCLRARNACPRRARSLQRLYRRYNLRQSTLMALVCSISVSGAYDTENKQKSKLESKGTNDLVKPCKSPDDLSRTSRVRIECESRRQDGKKARNAILMMTNSQAPPRRTWSLKCWCPLLYRYPIQFSSIFEVRSGGK